MQLYVFIGAALIALLAMLLPALAHKQHWNVIREGWRYPLRLGLGVLESELGVIVVTYCTPILGAPSVTAITGAQAAQVSEQQAQIFWADADTGALFVHNWGLPSSYATWLWPQIFMTQALGGSDSLPGFTFGISNSNSVSITKSLTAAGSGGTWNVYLRRPYSASQ
jgi:hypothetical protein